MIKKANEGLATNGFYMALNECFKCHERDPEFLIKLYGYTVCKLCKSGLGLLQDKTIKKHQNNSERKALLSDVDVPLFHEEVQMRLNKMDRDYIGKRIKLLHILDRLDKIP